MTDYIDRQFINIAASRLDRFKWKKNDLANCRCCFCGDSSKNKIKARGYFYRKKNNFFYKCHNCGVSVNLYNFLEKLDPNLCKEYAIQRWKDGQNGNSNYKKPTIEISFETEKKLNKNILSGLPTLSSLENDHPAYEYARKRRIPKKYFDILLYSEKFNNLIESNSIKKDERIVIPVYDTQNNLHAFQGRSIHFSPIKYITKKVTNQRIWFGQKDITDDTVFVTEGPIDSMFIPNSVATLGMSNWREIPEELQKKNLIFVLDNEPRNKQVTEIMLQIVKEGYKICIWPKNIIEKDINEMIMHGYKQQELKSIILKNSYDNLEATFLINIWRQHD